MPISKLKSEETAMEAVKKNGFGLRVCFGDPFGERMAEIGLFLKKLFNRNNHYLLLKIRIYCSLWSIYQQGFPSPARSCGH